jgi:hypothetical protein
MSSSYTPQQLAAMARTALAARDRGDPRWLLLNLKLALLYDLTPAECEQRIEQLAVAA